MAAKKTAKKTTEPMPSQDSAPKPVAKKTTKTAKKAVAKKAAPATAKKTARIAPAKPSLDVVARAAYLNYRRRVEQDLPGDSHGDWLEAEKQFMETD